jgi:hypothetical protein
MIKKLAAGVLTALLLNACAYLQEEEKLPPQPQAPGVELIKMQNGRFIAFVGQRRQHTAKFLDVDDTNFFTLRSWYDNKTGEAAHQLYIADSYFGPPQKWYGVHDADNKTLKFIPISRNEITCEQGCSYADEFAAELSEDYLRAHKDGLALIFTSSDGKNLPVNVPADLVGAQLAAVDTVRGIAAKNATAPPAPAATTAPAPAAAAPPAPAATTAPAPAATTAPAPAAAAAKPPGR